MEKKKVLRQKVARETSNILEEQITRLEESIPEAFTEGKIDFDKLRNTLGNFVDARAERYSFSWAGKKDALRLLQTPSRATLIPAPNESEDFSETKNLFIEGDNLEVLKLLYKAYFGRVKMIYIDPPYNTGKDFVYPDNYADPLDTYLKITGDKDSEGNLLTNKPEKSGRVHSAWLSMMYPRLYLARQLLQEDGVIFASIDDNEVHNLRLLMNEIFGEENFVGCITIKSNPRGRDYGGIAQTHEYVLVFSKNMGTPINDLFDENKTFPFTDKRGPFETRELRNRNIAFTKENRPNLYYPFYLNPKKKDENGFLEISLEKKTGLLEVWPKESQGYNTVWRWGKEKSKANLNTEIVGREMDDGGYQIVEKYREKTKMARSIWDDNLCNTERGTLHVKELFDGKKVFPFPKPHEMIQKMVEMGSTVENPGIIMDFFAGSGSTAEAVFEQNKKDGGKRNFVCIQLPEPMAEGSEARKAGYTTIADICKERIRRIVKKLKAEGKQQKIVEVNGKQDLGFKVFKLAESNYRAWPGVAEKDPQEYAKQMALFADPLMAGWKPENVIWEVAIKEGFGLSTKIEALKEVKNNKVFTVTDPDKRHSFRVCLDEKIKASTLKELLIAKNDLFICRDVALDDELAANLALQCRLKTI